VRGGGGGRGGGGVVAGGSHVEPSVHITTRHGCRTHRQDQQEPIFLDLTVCTLFASQVKSTDFQLELADSHNPSTCNGASATMAPQLPLKVLFVCYIAVAIASGVIAGAAKKPNIVWVLTDDQDQVRF
jgi:hypothetical protein